MVRARIPGGRLTADQYLALDGLAGRYGNGSLRVTTRQSIQFHGVVKAGLKPAIAEINGAMLTTLAACGDVVRKVTTVPAPLRDPVHRRLEDDAPQLSTHLCRRPAPITRSGSKARGDRRRGRGGPDPLYGERYLPRKFKIGLAIPEDNTIDVLTNDLGIVALFEGETLTGYNSFSAAAMGSPTTSRRPIPDGNPRGLCRAGRPARRGGGGGAAAPRFGDRGNRRHARLKYVIAERGEEWARERLSEDLGKASAPCRDMPPFRCPTISVGTSRATAASFSAYRSSAAASSTTSAPAAHRIARNRRRVPLRPDPDAEPGHHPVGNPPPTARRHRQAASARRAAGRGHAPVERWALACPALPSCGLALTEAERVQGDIVDAIAVRLSAGASSRSG